MGYYDELIQQLQLNRYDGIVGDITITSNRSKYGYFTQPYMMSGISMIVPIVDSHTDSPWWFLMPFTWKLCLLMIALFLSKGILVWIIECEGIQELSGTCSEKVGKIISYSYSIFSFAQKKKFKRDCSTLVVDVWRLEFLVFGIAYASIMQAILKSNNGQPIVTDVEQLIMNRDYVGYQKGSFVFDHLKAMGFQEQKLKAYISLEEYATALSSGNSNNGVSAIIDETPYLKLFLPKYGDRFTMAGQTFITGGFGVLFQRDSVIGPNICRAVLQCIEEGKMADLEKKWFGSHESNFPPLNRNPRSDISLSLHDFHGFLIITETLFVCTLLIFFTVFITKKYWETMR